MAESDLQLSYTFTPQEVRVLARFFRKGSRCVPAGLERLSQYIESAVYGAMTLEEVQQLYEG